MYSRNIVFSLLDGQSIPCLSGWEMLSTAFCFLMLMQRVVLAMRLLYINLPKFFRMVGRLGKAHAQRERMSFM